MNVECLGFSTCIYSATLFSMLFYPNLFNHSVDDDNATCAQYNSCSSCLSSEDISCDWCSSDSSCLSTSHSSSCPTQIVGTCSEAYYTIIFLVILAGMLCLCCGTCYLRRTRHDDFMMRLLAPMLPQTARGFVFRNSLRGEGELEWMCVICGFDNKPRAPHCTMCGTSHEFSDAYKTKKLEKKRKRQARKDEKEKNRFVLGNVVSDVNNRNNSNDDNLNTTNDQGNSNSNCLIENANLLAASEEENKRQEDQQISNISLSLRHFKGARLTHEERSEAINYRRMNILTMRQKSARRRKLWQRVWDEQSRFVVWERVPVKRTKIGSAPFGYTPRPSISLNQSSSFRLDSDDDSSVSLLSPPRKQTLSRSLSKSPLSALLSASKWGKHKDTTARDSFDDSAFSSNSPGFTSVFDEERDELVWERVERGQRVESVGTSKYIPPKVTIFHRAPTTTADNNVHEGRSEERKGTDYHDDFRGNTTDLLSIAAYTFKDKQLWFCSLSSQLLLPLSQGFIRINVNRSNLLLDSFQAVMSINTNDLHKAFKFNFIGEMGIDAGGLEREWYTLICKEIFSFERGFFTSCSAKGNNTNSYHINPLVHLHYKDSCLCVNEDDKNNTENSISDKNYLLYYQFIGRVLGKALLSQQTIQANLSLPLRKQIINVPITFSDLEFIDEELYHNLLYLKHNSNIINLGLDFSISYSYRDKHVTYELLPNGGDIMVNDQNKQEYLKLRLKHRMLDSVQQPLKYLLTGFYEVIPADIVSVFDYMEFDLLLCGVPEISLEDWIRHTEYQGEYHSKYVVIKWFWKAVENMSHEERVRLLQFSTGCARLPVQGFKALQSSDGRYRKFNIQPIHKSDCLYPRAHTCFNKLDLPRYDNFQELEAYLSIVVNSMDIITGFTME